MSLNLSLRNSFSGGGSSSTSKKGPSALYGRVVDVILDELHPMYQNKGGGIAINGVFFKPLNSNRSEEAVEDMPFAYQKSSHIKVVPLIGEIVAVESHPVPSSNDVRTKNRKYYESVLNIWNNANNNFYPDTINNSNIDFTQGGKFVELGNVNPIGSGPGDVQFEGRQGQSIRFTGAASNTTGFIDSTNIGSPAIVISNGQKETKGGYTTLGEDVNEDSSSIYLVSNHKIPLKQASEKRDAWDESPTKADQFKGNQVIINGGRLYFNAKENDIQLSSVSSIGLNTEGTINLDSKKYLCLDGSSIYLGSAARSANKLSKEPVVLGNQMEGFLMNLLNMLEGMANDMARARTIKNHPIPALNKRGLQAKPVIQALKNRINPNGPSTLKSKKVFTE
jgi:hypothetical protein